MFDAISALIGPIPAGYEPIVYVLCVPFLMWLLGQFFGILWSLRAFFMLGDLNSLVGFVFSTFSGIFGLYIGGGILSGVFAIWLLRKIARLFDKLR